MTVGNAQANRALVVLLLAGSPLAGLGIRHGSAQGSAQSRLHETRDNLEAGDAENDATT